MKKSIVQGSIAEFMMLIAAGDCKGDISELCSAFGDRVYCHQRKQVLPLVMAPALTPFYTKDIGLEGHATCEIHCGRGCQHAGFMDNVVDKDTVVCSIQAFKLGPDNALPTRSEQLAAGLQL